MSLQNSSLYFAKKMASNSDCAHFHAHDYTPLVLRLVKYTGYRRAASLLMSKDLLGGGTSPGQSTYSSDEEDSDTEEYMQSK